MPGVVDSPPRLAADALQMAKADDDFHFKSLYWTHRGAAYGLPVPLCGFQSPFLPRNKPTMNKASEYII
jgi:hypothetical protein